MVEHFWYYLANHFSTVIKLHLLLLLALGLGRGVAVKRAQRGDDLSHCKSNGTNRFIHGSFKW